MRGEKKTAAMQNMVSALYEYGYIDDKYKRMLLYRIDTGDTKVFAEIRNYLIKLCSDIAR